MNKKKEPSIAIRACLSLDYLCILFGSSEASVRYVSLIAELEDMQSELTTKGSSLAAALKNAVDFRSQIIRENGQRVIPLTVHRIDVCPEGSMMREDIDLQVSSRYDIPIFVDKSLTVGQKSSPPLPSLPLSWDVTTVNGIEGFVVEMKESSFVSEKKTMGCVVDCVPRAIVVSTRKSDFLEKGKAQTVMKKGNLHYYHGIEKKALREYMQLTVKKKAIIHICNDFVTHNGLPYGRGVSYCSRALESLPNGLFFTGCVINYLSLDRGKCNFETRKEMGSLYELTVQDTSAK